VNCLTAAFNASNGDINATVDAIARHLASRYAVATEPSPRPSPNIVHAGAIAERLGLDHLPPKKARRRGVRAGGGTTGSDQNSSEQERRYATHGLGVPQIRFTTSLKIRSCLIYVNAGLGLGPSRAEADIESLPVNVRPHLSHQQAGHVTAPDQCCTNVRMSLPGRRPHVTHFFPRQLLLRRASGEADIKRAS